MDKHKTPVIDERLDFRGPSFLRQMNSQALRDLERVIVIQDGPEADRLAVLIPYRQYLKLQKEAGI